MLLLIPDQFILAFITADFQITSAKLVTTCPASKMSLLFVLSPVLFVHGEYTMKKNFLLSINGILEGVEVNICLFNSSSLTRCHKSLSLESEWKPMWWVSFDSRSIFPYNLVSSQNISIASKYVWFWCIDWFGVTNNLTSLDERIRSTFWAYHKYAKLSNKLRKWFVLQVEQSFHIFLNTISLHIKTWYISRGI